MILLINTADQKKVFLGLADNKKMLAKREFTAQFQQAEKLLPEIDWLLKKQAFKPKNLQGIIVASGPGPFTALRIGAIVANTLGWALKIPVVGVRLTEFKDVNDLISRGINKLKKAKVGNIIEPFYGQEPNITKRLNWG